MLQNRGLPRLILKNTLGLCAVLSCVHFPVGRTPFISGAKKQKFLKNRFFLKNILTLS